MPDTAISDNARHIFKKSLRRRKRLLPHVDMTPMVDLGFLLITFFMLTTKLNEQKAILWEKPFESAPQPVNECRVLNIIIDSLDRFFVYEGSELESLKLSGFNVPHDIGQLITDKNNRVKSECASGNNNKNSGVICLIKLLPGARYKNLVDIFDELNLLKIKTYNIQEPLKEETLAVAQKTKTLPAIN